MRLFYDLYNRFYPYAEFHRGEPWWNRRWEKMDKRVYLTFDDGPIPEVTPKVLDILVRYDAKATFFMVGENIDKHPEVFDLVTAAGHSIGNHTYNHLKGWRVSTETYMQNIEHCQDVIERNLPKSYYYHSGVGRTLDPNWAPPVRLFRPPYGKATYAQRKLLDRCDFRIIYWDILTRDYDARRTPEQMLKQIKNNARPGSIINFHDSLKSNERMLEVLPKAIEWLQSKGYELEGL